MVVKAQKIFSILSGRVARNIYLWAYLMIDSINPANTTAESWFRIYLYVLEMVLVYFNNLVLIPRLLVRRKYVWYAISIFAATFTIFCCYVYSCKLLLYFHPATKINNISVILLSGFTDNMSFVSVLSQMRGVFFTLLTLVFFFSLAWYIQDYARQQRVAEEAKKKQVETELLFLKEQINPHFLFNTLNNLYGLSLAGSEKAPEAILKLSSILRYLIYDSNTDKVEFSKEKEIMLAYIDLELLRLHRKDGLTFSITADADYMIPPLLWMAILENTFKHGTRFIAEAYEIYYRFAITDNILTIQSKNKYKAEKHPAKADARYGVGLANLEQRLAILYPGKYKMKISCDEEYFFADLEIVLNQ